MRDIRLFAKGRLLPTAILLAAIDLLLGFTYWDARYPLYVGGQGMPVYIIVPVLIGYISTTLSIVCIAPRVPTVDRLAVGKTAMWSVTAAAAITGIEISAPLIAYWVLAHIPTTMVPNHKAYITGDLRFTDVVPLNTAVFSSASIALYAAVTLCAVGLFGKVSGVLSSLVGFIASIGVISMMPHDSLLRGNIRGAETGVAVYAAIALFIFAVSLIVWGISKASAPLNPTTK